MVPRFAQLVNSDSFYYMMFCVLEKERRLPFVASLHGSSLVEYT